MCVYTALQSTIVMVFGKLGEESPVLLLVMWQAHFLSLRETQLIYLGPVHCSFPVIPVNEVFV